VPFALATVPWQIVKLGRRCAPLIAVVVTPLLLAAQAPPTGTASGDVEAAVRAYTTGFNSGNAAAMAELFVRDARAALIEDGQLWRSWEKIRARLDSVADAPRLYGAKLELRTVDVTGLGTDYALAIVTYAEILGPPTNQYPRAMVAVFHRAHGQWRAINVHISTRPPPE